MSKLSAIIVEDEAGATNQLTLILKSINEDIIVLNVLRSIEEAVEWITSNRAPDLAFFDIQLEDGLSFEIFKQCKVGFPVIFTTAYDQYAIEAFKVNSVDYLLKPIKESDLRFSITKYRDLKGQSIDQFSILQLIDTIALKQKVFTLLIHVKDKLIPIEENDFAYFYLEQGILKGYTKNNQLLPIDQNIEALVKHLNKQLFFRANRQVIVNRGAIREAEFYFNGRLSLKLLPQAKMAVLISKARVAEFKEWLAG